MKILLTLDYELFLGSRTGSIDKCLIQPMDTFLEKTNEYGAKFTIFVDATFLYKLKEYSNVYQDLVPEYQKVTNHIKSLHSLGHDIQLHIHPHWFYSKYNGTEWILDHNHYKLCDLPLSEAEDIFVKSKTLLEEIVGKKLTAFRAGGFSTQPSNIIKHLFDLTGVKIDSSVCPGNTYDSPQQKYDYSDVPNKDIYYFNDDICVESKERRFVELPITTHRVSPLFYWKLAFARLTKQQKHNLLADGQSVKTTSDSIVKRLTHYVLDMATIDGIKISCLKHAYKQQKNKNAEYMCVLGHPKLATIYSIENLEKFCKMIRDNNDNFITISECNE